MKPWIHCATYSILLAVMTVLCLSRSAGRTGSPDGWSRDTRKQPFVSQSVLATGPQSWNVWSLSAYQGFVSDRPSDGFSVDMTLPDSGRVSLVTNHTNESSGSALLLAVGSKPTGLLRQADGEDQPLECTGSVTPIASGRHKVSMTHNETGWVASIGNQTLQCATTDTTGQPSITAGLRRVSIHSMSNGTEAKGPATSAIFWGLGAAAGWFTLLLGVGRKSPTMASAMGLASLSGWLLIPIDGAYLAEMLRLIGVGADNLPLTFSLAMVAMTTAICLCAIWSKRKRLIGAALPPLVLFLAFAKLWPVIGSMGWLYAAFGGLSLAGLVWVNVHASTIRHYNFIALALAGTMMGSAEVMVRYSHVGSLWNSGDANHGAGSMNTLFTQFEKLQSGRHSFYPGEGFPVRVPPKQKDNRIVCLGASSTGGAFQNDSLDEFYPARLAELRPESTEVVNQGVGGWTSFHIRIFLDGHAETLNAEVWTLYLGVNENRPTPMPFADIYDAWQSGDMTETFDALDNIRLYQGLRLLARGLKPSRGVGVPPDDFKENLEHISALAHKHGVKLLLMSEAVRPDPNALWSYADTMREVAASANHVEFLDTAAALHPVGAKAFMDSNHLTDTGHRTLANTIGKELDRLRWW
jgi:hypothetical protein